MKTIYDCEYENCDKRAMFEFHNKEGEGCGFYCEEHLASAVANIGEEVIVSQLVGVEPIPTPPAPAKTLAELPEIVEYMPLVGPRQIAITNVESRGTHHVIVRSHYVIHNGIAHRTGAEIEIDEHATREEAAKGGSQE